MNPQVRYIADNFDTALKAHIAGLDWDQFNDALEACDLPSLDEYEYTTPAIAYDAHPQLEQPLADHFRAAVTDDLMLEYDQMQLGGTERIPTARTRGGNGDERG